MIRAISGSDSGEVADVVDSHMEAYSTAAIANYDTDLTEQGTASRYYDMTIPSFLAAGHYRIDILQKDGSSTPSETDIHIGHGAFGWDGSDLVPITGDAFARLGAPAGASVSADIATVDTVVDSILVDTAEIGSAGAGLTGIPYNSAWDADIQSECNDALVALGLDHLMSASVAGTDVADDSVIAQLVSASGTADWDDFDNGTDSLQAIRDRGDANWSSSGASLVLQSTTIATLASQTSFTLTAGSSDDDAYNGCLIVITDSSTTTQKAVGVISDYTGSTKTVTLLNDPGVFTMAVGDTVDVIADRALKATVDNRTLDVTATGAAGIDWGNVENASTAVDLSGTDIQLCDTITTYTGNTVQTGDAFARLGAPAGASVSADIATIDSNVDAILVDTAEIGAAGAGLTAVPWNSSWDAEVQSECNDALVALGLDHLVNAAVVGADVTDNSIFAKIVSKSATADWDDFINTTDSLQAIRDKQTDIETDTAEIGAAGAGLTAVPWNSSWDAEVQSEVTDSLVAHNLDHLCLTATAAADMTTEVADDTILARILANGNTSDFVPSTDGLQLIRDKLTDIETDTQAIEVDTQDIQSRLPAALISGRMNSDVTAISGDASAADNLEKEYDGTGFGLLLVRTTIGTLASQTSFTLSAGSVDDDAYNGCEIVIEDASTAAQKAVGVISDYTGSTKTITLLNDPGVFTMAATDIVSVFASKSLKPTVDNNTLDVTSTGAAGIDWGNVENPTTAVDLSGTDIQLCDTITTYTGNTVQTGDAFARLGAPAGASVSADIATVDSNVDAILVDTAEIGAAGAGLTAIPYNSSWDADIQSECNDALVALGLDHLVSASVTGTDITDNSIIAKLVSKEATADWDDYVNTTDSLQAIRDRGDTSWITSTFSITAATIADAVWDEAQADHVAAGSFGLIASEIADILVDTGTTLDGKIDTIDSNVDAILVDTGTTLPATLGTPADTDLATDIANVRGADSDTLKTISDQIDGLDTDALRDTTIATVTSQTVFTITAGSGTNDVYNGCPVVLIDSNGDESLRRITDYVGATKTVTIDSAPDFTIVATDQIKIFRRVETSDTNGEVTVSGYNSSLDFNSTQKASINAEADTALTDYDALVPADLPTNFADLSITATTGRVDVASIEGTDATDQIRDAIVDDSTRFSGASIAAILADTNSLDATKIPDTISLANINAQVDTALTDIGLDHLFSAAIVGADVTNNSFAARITSKSATADYDDFVNTTDSLQAIRDSQADSAPTAEVIADTVWDELQSAHTTSGSFGEIATEIASILADTNELQTDDVPGLIAALNNVSAADVNAQVDTALSDIGLDHLVSASVAGTDITDNSIIAKMVSKETIADWDDFVNTTDSLQALRDNQAPAAPTAAAVADAVWDESTTGHVTPGTFGEQVKTDIDAILVDTSTTLDGKIDTIDSNVDAILVDTGTTLDGKINTLDTNVDSLVTAVITNAAGVDISADVAAVKSDTAATLVDTNELQTDWTNGGRLDLLLDQIVAEVVTAAGEPAQGAPPVSANLMDKVSWLYKMARNKTEQTSSTYSLYDDAGTTVDTKATVSDDGTTFTRGELLTGP